MFESIEYQDNKDNNDNNLKIFEIISDTKIKSIIEYEKEKNNNDIQILKNNFDIRNNNENNDENNINKYMYKREEYNILLRKESSKDTFSFRPTNNDSREISDQDYNFNNNILLELEKNLKKNEEEYRIKIIKKKKKIKNYK